MTWDITWYDITLHDMTLYDKPQDWITYSRIWERGNWGENNDMTWNITWHDMTLHIKPQDWLTCSWIWERSNCGENNDITWNITWHDMTWHDIILGWHGMFEGTVSFSGKDFDFRLWVAWTFYNGKIRWMWGTTPPQFSTIIWYSFLSMALVSNRLKLWIFSFWLDCCLKLFHDNAKADLVVLITKDSCDGSGLNTSESSKGSHPFVN